MRLLNLAYKQLHLAVDLVALGDANLEAVLADVVLRLGQLGPQKAAHVLERVVLDVVLHRLEIEVEILEATSRLAVESLVLLVPARIALKVDGRERNVVDSEAQLLLARARRAALVRARLDAKQTVLDQLRIDLSDQTAI